MTIPAYDIVNGDMLTELPRMHAEGVRFDCAITDPPYHLGSITKRFGKEGSAPAQHGRDGAAARLSKGFMGWTGDSGEISFDPATWRLVFDVLKPGGRLLAFGGSRTWWRIAAAIDAAGFEFEDTIMWVYGQGLVLHRSRLKPCWEPILMFRKPGRVLDLNIEECRVPTSDDLSVHSSPGGYGGPSKGKMKAREHHIAEGQDKGRWPGNVCHDGSEDVLSCFPDTPGQIAKAKRDGTHKHANVYGRMNHESDADPEPREDEGSAARFFTCCPFDEAEEVRRVVYESKAKGSERVFRCDVCHTDLFRQEREAHRHGFDNFDHLKTHPTLKPLTLMEHLVRLVCPKGGLVLDPFAGTGTTVLAAVRNGRDAIGIEQDAVFAGHAQLRLDAYRNIR